ncbi:MAG: HEAT repeat domain-containing protein, partial [Armatimonadetes bacterium]|nr:HEAT repeat domain-containing protein [Armatimonadota bacterium]
ITKLRKMGVAVVPYLVDVLTNDTSVTARKGASVIFLYEPTFTQRAIPTLIKAFEDSDPIVRELAVSAFANSEVGIAGKAALPALIRAFKSHGDKNVRSCAASALRCVGGGDKDTVQALVDALKTEKDDGVRFSIVRALIGPGRGVSIAKIAVPALIAVLSKDKHGGVRQTAMNSIAWYFENGRSAVPALAKVLRNEKDREVRYFAVDALGKVGGDDALIALISGLKDKDNGVRETVKSKLEFMGEPATGLLKRALKMEKEESATTRVR